MTEPEQHTSDNAFDAFGDELPAGAELCGGAYTIEKYINSGGFGITYLARDSLGRRVVIKECFPSAMCYRQNKTVRLRSRNTDDEFTTILELFEKEARALAELSHPYIVGVHQIFHDNATAYMAIDYIDGADLLQVIEDEPGRLQPADVHELLLRCLEAVDYIHERDILHRDISPDNILLDPEGNPVLIDFGAARESATRVSRVLSKVLTVKDGYSPQEFYLQGSKQEYSSDLYALAATFYHLVSGKAPPSSHLRMAAAARGGEDPLVLLDRESAQGYPDHFIDAINTCLSIFPGDRLPSAIAWRDMIDVERRRQILLEIAEEDRDLEERVYKLVAEYRRSLKDEAAAQAKATADAKETPTPPAKPTPPKRRSRTAAPMLLQEPLAADEKDDAPDVAAAPRVAGEAPQGPAPTCETTAAEATVAPQAAPPPGPPSDAAAAPDPLLLGDPVQSSKLPDPPPAQQPGGFRKLLTGTKTLILGQGRARYE
ncbi:MAG: serine/threonine-protein kinase [Pseudomonadota bacterium]